jgi:hypothetical protein
MGNEVALDLERLDLEINFLKASARNKVYQVFVSSTIKDLQEERRTVINTILKKGFLPAGMELFAAGNDEQWGVIEQRIRSCDYYVVIVAERYGSIAQDGLSYTEKEYRFAKTIGVPIAALLLDPDADWPRGKIEFDRAQQINDFRKLCEMKLCKYWKTKDELALECALALDDLVRKHPRPGLVSSVASETTTIFNIVDALKIIIQTHGQEYVKEFLYSNKFMISIDIKEFLRTKQHSKEILKLATATFNRIKFGQGARGILDDGYYKRASVYLVENLIPIGVPIIAEILQNNCADFLDTDYNSADFYKMKQKGIQIHYLAESIKANILATTIGGLREELEHYINNGSHLNEFGAIKDFIDTVMEILTENDLIAAVVDFKEKKKSKHIDDEDIFFLTKKKDYIREYCQHILDLDICLKADQA